MYWDNTAYSGLVLWYEGSMFYVRTADPKTLNFILLLEDVPHFHNSLISCKCMYISFEGPFVLEFIHWKALVDADSKFFSN